MCEANRKPSDRGWNFDGQTDRLIAHKARQLCRLPGLTSSDVEDVEQELKLHLFQKSHLFDPTRASAITFANCVLENKACSIVRQLKAKKRIYFQDVLSLDVEVTDTQGGTTPLVNLIETEAVDQKMGRQRPDHLTLKQLRHDVREVSQSIPGHLRILQSRLGLVSPGMAREVLGISRRQLADQMQQLRGHFQAAGLGA